MKSKLKMLNIARIAVLTMGLSGHSYGLEAISNDVSVVQADNRHDPKVLDGAVVVENDSSLIGKVQMTGKYLFESAITNAFATWSCKDAWVERERGWVDLNGDGVDDVILSEAVTSRGTGGLPYTVLVASNGVYRAIGGIGGSMGWIWVERREDRSFVIWSYWHSSCQTGQISSFEVTPWGETYSGGVPVWFDEADGGLGNDFVKALGKWAAVPIRWEVSKTIDGKVSWDPVKLPKNPYEK